jgi:hypothetical protein
MTTSAMDAPLTVSTDGTAGPYVVVTPEQYGAVTEALRAEEVRFHLDQNAVLAGGGPALVLIDLGIGADVERVQRILDRVSGDLCAKRKHRQRPPTRKELIVRGEAAAMRELRRRLDIETEGGWSRRPDIEARFRNTLPKGTSAFCFAKLVPAIGRQIVVLMQGRGPGDEADLYPSGIVPLEGREPLGIEQHDLAVADFHTNLIGPLSRDLGVRVLVCSVPVRPSFEDTLSLESLARLKYFSKVANKGILHELDLRIWAAFIGQTHLDDVVLDLDQLDTWLADEGFEESPRSHLLREYESGRRLLRAYDEERQ